MTNNIKNQTVSSGLSWPKNSSTPPTYEAVNFIEFTNLHFHEDKDSDVEESKSESYILHEVILHIIYKQRFKNYKNACCTYDSSINNDDVDHLANLHL